MSDKCEICGHYISNHGRHGCHVDDCKCGRTYYVADRPSYAEQAAEIERLREEVKRWKAEAMAAETYIHQLTWNKKESDPAYYAYMSSKLHRAANERGEG